MKIDKVTNFPAFVVIEIIFLSISGLYQFVFNPAKTFGDTYRYWNPETGIQQLFDFSQHLGAFFPVLLFSLAPSIRIVSFLNLFVWFATAVISISLLNRLQIATTTKILATAFVTLTWTSNLLLLWTNTGLADSIGLCLLALGLVQFVIFLYSPVSIQNVTRVSFVLFLLAMTKPAWVLLFAPVILVVIFVRMKQKVRLALVISTSAIAFLSVIFVLSGVKQPYVEGLTYEGWWSFTRAAHLGQVPELRQIAEGEIVNCPEISNLYEILRSRQTRNGMTTNYPQVLKSCPGIVDYLNQNHNSVLSIAFAEPKNFLLTAFDWLGYMSVPGFQYMDFELINFFPLSLFAPIYSSGLIFSILIAVGIVLYFYSLREKITAGLIILGTFILFCLMVPTDGLEPLRHSAPFALFPLLGTLLILILGSNQLNRQANKDFQLH